MNLNETQPVRPWRHIVALVLWLYLLTPVGLWKLWQDKTLSDSAKWRVFLYGFVLPLSAYIAASMWTANRTLQRLLP